MGESKRKRKAGTVIAHDLTAMEHSPVHEAALTALKMQMLIVLVNRLGGKVDIPMTEIDATGQFLLGFSLEIPKRPTGDTKLDASIAGVFHFEVRKKQ